MSPEKKAQLDELRQRVDRMDDIVLGLEILTRREGQHAQHCTDAAIAIRNAMARRYDRVRAGA
jgi:hypothetical protein